MNRIEINVQTGERNVIPLTEEEIREANERAAAEKIEQEKDRRAFAIQALARKKLEEEYDALSDKEKENLLK